MWVALGLLCNMHFNFDLNEEGCYDEYVQNLIWILIRFKIRRKIWIEIIKMKTKMDFGAKFLWKRKYFEKLSSYR